MQASLSLGRVLQTRGIAKAVVAGQIQPSELLSWFGRHRRRDWGDIGCEDWRANDTCPQSGECRLFSVHRSAAGDKVWIITEADRYATTVLFPDEY